MPDSGVLPPPWEDQIARVGLRWSKSSTAVISAHGEIDASNADALAEYTLAHVADCRSLVLDLRDVNFFGASGFSALHEISAGCARAGVGWALLSGAAVSRSLRIGDAQGTLPVAIAIDTVVDGGRLMPPKLRAMPKSPNRIRYSP
jgi:anti-anti-sigma factor